MSKLTNGNNTTIVADNIKATLDNRSCKIEVGCKEEERKVFVRLTTEDGKVQVIDLEPNEADSIANLIYHAIRLLDGSRGQSNFSF